RLPAPIRAHHRPWPWTWPGEQPPGLVRPDHPGQQPEPAQQPRRHEPLLSLPCGIGPADGVLLRESRRRPVADQRDQIHHTAASPTLPLETSRVPEATTGRAFRLCSLPPESAEFPDGAEDRSRTRRRRTLHRGTDRPGRPPGALLPPARRPSGLQTRRRPPRD